MKEKKESRFIKREHLDKIGEVAIYYGFTPAKSPVVTKEDLEAAKDILANDTIDDETGHHGRLPLHAEEKISLIRTYHEQNMQSLSQPVMLYFKDPFKGNKKGGYHRYADMEILGTSGAIAEATLIQTARLMLAEEGYKHTAVEVNSVGDRDSIARFSRELTTYYRKHLNDMTPECRQLFKDDPFEVLSAKNETCDRLNEQAPKSLDFLTEGSRRHLEELLEYFEALGIEYTVNNSLVANRKYATETVFAIVNADAEQNKKEQRILAVGVRYNGLAKRLNMKRDLQGVGISLLIKGEKPPLRKTLAKTKRPIASFIQLSPESKRVALEVVENLRQAKIPLYLSLAKDRLGAQVSCIEKHCPPYVIVMGKKEAVDRTVVVRRTETHAQETVPIVDLARHMKKIESGYWR